MVQVEPSTADQEILAALSARDDAASWNDWALYRSLKLPIFGGLLRLPCWHCGFV